MHGTGSLMPSEMGKELPFSYLDGYNSMSYLAEHPEFQGKVLLGEYS
jgi:hypothetical protein